MVSVARRVVLLALAATHTSGVLLNPDLRVLAPTAVPAPPALPSAALVPPRLTGTERRVLLRVGEVQRKSRRGREGECLTVVETALASEDCWERITDVANWSSLLRGVRSSKVVDDGRADGRVRADFLFTKLRLPATLLLRADRCTVFPDRCELHFELDPASPSCAVKRCTGKWVVERASDGATRVSLKADIQATRLVPGQVVDFVAERALDRAVAWIPRRNPPAAALR